MNKKEFDTEIARLIRRDIELDTLTLKCTIWHGDGCYNENGTVIYTQTEIIDEDFNAVIERIVEGSDKELFEENEEDMKEVKAEQKKIIAKISKWINPNWGMKIVADEQNV